MCEAVVKLAPELARELPGMELATKFQDLQLKEGEVPKNANTMYEPTITAEFLDLSPSVVLYREDASALTATAKSAKGTSPSTEAESNWGMFAGTAAIFCGALAVAYCKYGKI